MAATLIFSCFVFTTDAADNELVPGSEIRCTFSGDPLVYTFTPDTDVEAVLYTKDADTNIDTNVFVYLQDDSDWSESNDDSFQSLNFCYYNTFEAGRTYVFEIGEYNNNSGDFTLVFEEFAISSVELLSVPELHKDIYGEIDPLFEGILLKINYKDSSMEADTVAVDESGYAFEEDYALECYYSSEENDYLNIILMGKLYRFTVEVTTKTPTKLEILSPPSCTLLYEGVDCTEVYFYNEEKNGYESGFVYDVFYFGTKLKVTYDNGSEDIMTYEDDGIFFSELTDDLDSQLTSPWGVGKHTVTVSFGAASDSFEVTVAENPYVSAEITKLPNNTSSLLNGNGFAEADENNDVYFYYYTSLDGIEITLTDKDGGKKVIHSNDFELSKLYAHTDQETDHWNVGDHTVNVTYGTMDVGSYTFSVLNEAITEISITEPAEAAFFYPEYNSINVNTKGMMLRIVTSDSTSEKVYNVAFDDLENTVFSDTVYLDFDLDDVGTYYFVTTSEISSEEIYLEVIDNQVESISITNPPERITYIENYGIDVGNVDLTGLEITISLSDGQSCVWKWDESDKSGIFTVLDGILSIDIGSYEVTVSYRLDSFLCMPTETKQIKDYSIGTIEKNTKLQLDIDSPQLCVYTFDPQESSSFDLTVYGESFTHLTIFADESGEEYVFGDYNFSQQGLTNAEKETHEVYFSTTPTYYLLLERNTAYDKNSDGIIEFEVSYLLYGDADANGEISTRDVLTVRRYLADLIDESEIDLMASDVDGSGDINVRDVLYIRQYLADLISYFPAECE